MASQKDLSGVGFTNSELENTSKVVEALEANSPLSNMRNLRKALQPLLFNVIRNEDESASPWLTLDVYMFVEIIDCITFQDFVRLGSVLFSSKKLAKQWDSFRPKLNSRTLNNHVYRFKTLDMLLHNEIRIRNAKTVYEQPLVEAATAGHTQIVKLLLDDGVDVNMQNRYGYTALSTASDKGHRDIVQLLLGVEGIDVNMQNSSGDTALTLASAKGHRDIVQLLLGVEGIDVNVKNRYGDTALVIASSNGRRDIVQLLLGVEGIDVNMKTSYGDTALTLASRKGHKEIVQLLQRFSREHSVKS